MKNLEESDELDLNAADKDVGILEYVTGSAEGRDYWAYVVMRPSLYLEYHALVAQGEAVSLTEFGEIVEQGIGKEAPEEIQARMLEEYGNPEMMDLLEAMGSDFMKIHEESEHVATTT